MAKEAGSRRPITSSSSSLFALSHFLRGRAPPKAAKLIFPSTPQPSLIELFSCRCGYWERRRRRRPMMAVADKALSRLLHRFRLKLLETTCASKILKSTLASSPETRTPARRSQTCCIIDLCWHILSSRPCQSQELNSSLTMVGVMMIQR